ncbi:putative Lysophospholipase 1 [Glarea lozoyensis 74030]|uniref:Lysophospholipase n=1 Tax=Glarea lozoyensis (strain ATCC 74030 / MF5533) TaxID=1104152 RepID=H0ELE8_GLAL7|nr:putative Lysophospholipase 1 [Glarea lozoyensis 74030]
MIGGLLQATTYLAGLSGGGWLVTSLYSNNFSSVETLRDGSPDSSVWKFGNSIFEGPNSDGIQILSTADYFRTISDEVSGKADAGLGFNTSITDYWGRALSYQMINASNGGPGYTFSSIAESDDIQNGQIPLPLLVADERSPNTAIVSLNSTVYEFNPWEMGSWDPTTYAFAPLQYTGSNFSAGSVVANQQCVRGFDNVGFVMDIGEDNNDIAQWQPNPFYGFNNQTNRNAQEAELTLVDGGEDLQNIPLYPLIQPQREVDVIFAIDSSADNQDVDTHTWPNGASLVATYNSNITTFTPSYNNSERNAIIQNGYDVATMGNGTLDAEWPTCMACAVLSRSFFKTGTAVPAACQTCFDRYCWNGTLDTATPADYYPTFKVAEVNISSGASPALVVTMGAYSTMTIELLDMV